VLFAELVETSAAVASTPARSAKVTSLAAVLRRLEADEVVPAVALLTGQPRQGKVGVGYQTVFGVHVEAAASSTLTIGDVDAAIEHLASLRGPGSATARQQALAGLLSRATPDEQELLRRLLVGELRQGALEGVMADAIARAAGVPLATVRRAAMLAGDLCEVAAAALVHGGEASRAAEALAAIDLQVLRPVLPMLASTAADVHEAIGALGRSSVEWKLDGARIQAHRDGGDVRLFTRNLNDVTARLPGVVDVVRAFACDQVVLDGEVVGAYDEDDGPRAFQDTMSAFSRQGPGDTDMIVRFFDCMFVDGRSLVDEPLSERSAVLDRVAGAWRVPSIVTADAEEAAAFLDGALASGHEGVMVKALTSAYEAGRRGGAWRKVKPVVTLDLVVLAAEWGHGRRQGWLSNLHLGARDDAGGGFVMVGKTFKGMTDELLTWQTAQLLEREVERRGIEVHVRPELVVEVAIDGVQASPRYAGGVTLRFARVRRYRDDKAPSEADTIQTLRALLRRSGET
jgi:DNA ligase-1